MGQIETVRKIKSDDGTEVLSLTRQFCIFLGRQGNVALQEETTEDTTT